MTTAHLHTSQLESNIAQMPSALGAIARLVDLESMGWRTVYSVLRDLSRIQGMVRKITAAVANAPALDPSLLSAIEDMEADVRRVHHKFASWPHYFFRLRRLLITGKLKRLFKDIEVLRWVALDREAETSKPAGAPFKTKADLDRHLASL